MVNLSAGLQTGTAALPVYSVVVPFYNEQDAAKSLIEEILSALTQWDGPAECICVDDGSKDGTAAVLNAFAEQPGSPVRVLSFTRNRGQAAALWAGLHVARGSVIITLDGDGQNDPADIRRLIAALPGQDMIVGIRQDRKDNAIRRWMSRLANFVRGRLLREGMRDSGCALKAFRREAIAGLIPIRTLYSFMPAMAASAGFKIRQIPVRHRDRIGGRSNYGFFVFLWRPVLDLLGMVWYTRRTFWQSDLIRTAIDERRS